MKKTQNDHEIPTLEESLNRIDADTVMLALLDVFLLFFVIWVLFESA